MTPTQSARFVGAAFERWPFISAIGAFMRVTRLNRYQPKDYRFAMGISVRRQDDLSYLMTFSPKRKDQLANALQISDELREQWEFAHWLPFQCEESVLEIGHAFRFCTECIRFGYHSLIHQLPWLQRCPWHGAQLRATCQRCGARLHMDGVSGNWLGLCKCGFDHVNERSAIRGFASTKTIESACEVYLAWASVERQSTVLIAPVPSANSVRVLAAAFDLPPALAPKGASNEGTGTKVHRAVARPEPRNRRGTEDALATTSKLENLVDTRGAMIEAPGRLAVRIAASACRFAGELPAGSLSDTEMTLFLEPAGASADRNFVPARRRSILEIRSLPLAQVGNRSYLDLHCVSKVVRQVAYRVLQWLDSNPAGDPHRAADTDVCLSAVHETLARGYSEGIRVVVGRHVPDLYRARRNRPHLSEPWVLMRKAAGSGLTVVLLWARQPHSPE